MDKGLDRWRNEWLSPKEGKDYGDLFFKRAAGQLPEMESSKAAAKRVRSLLGAGQMLADIGCGAGHYYRSLRASIPFAFRYLGVDATPYYVQRARAAFQSDANARFVEGDIFDLPLEDQAADAVMCNNVLLHLPSIAMPIAELLRIARRVVLARTLVWDRSYVVKDVAPEVAGDEFDETGEPRSFHFLNISSEKYLRRLLGSNERVRSVSFERDGDYDPQKVADTGTHLAHAWDRTSVANGMQVSGALLLPWTWVTVELAA